MDAPDLRPDDLSEDLAEIDALLQVLDKERDIPACTNVEALSRETGIAPERVRALLDRDDLAPENLAHAIRQRLVFLRETRLKPDKTRYTLKEISVGADISEAQVSYLLNGQRRSPGPDVLRNLEQFWGVDPGFFTATERQALHRALQPTLKQLRLLEFVTSARSEGIRHVAMRSITGDRGDGELDRELRAAFTAALTRPEPEDPEVADLTDEMRSLPTKSRSRVFPEIRTLLGMARSESDDSAAQSPDHSAR